MPAKPNVLELGAAGEPDAHDDGEGKRPHEYRCAGCEKHKVCWSCGASVRIARCTNGACMNCHLSRHLGRWKCGGHPEAA